MQRKPLFGIESAAQEKSAGQNLSNQFFAGRRTKARGGEATLTELGLVGDDHNFPDIHGGPERALCLFSIERILEFQAEGHPIFPGAAGENVTVSGLDWEKLGPGVRLALGDEVLIEITKYTSPCNSMTELFSDGNYARLSQKANPGYSRVYARALQTGRLVVGQLVRVLDGSPDSTS